MDPTAPSPGEEAVVRHALARGLLAPAQVEEARRAAAARRAPLLDALRPLLRPEHLPELVAVFRAAQDPRARPGERPPAPGVAPVLAAPSLAPAAGVAPTVAAPPPPPAAGVAPTVAAPGPTPAHGVARPGPPAPAQDPLRTQAVAALQAALARDPRFAPHLDLVLERRALLGEGGMGAVHRVLDRRLGREAALKVMRAAPAHPVDVARFVREAEVTARLDHPAIPPVYEAGTDAAGRQYLLMRVIEGQPLSTAIHAAHAGGRPRLRALVPLLEALVKVGEAVAYAHSRRVVHRDLKPGNVMVGSFGEVLVLDWGLVRLLDAPDDDALLRGGAPPLALDAAGAPGLTQVGALLGTPGYMAPEQAAAEAISEKTDVYALGAMLVDVLTGRPPVGGGSVLDVVHRTVQGAAERPRARWAGCPRDLDALAAAALALDPAARPTAEAFVADLRAFLAGEDLAAYRYGPLERAVRAARRRPAALVGAVGALLLAAVGAGLSAQVASARAASAQAEVERGRAEAARAAAASVAAEQSRTAARVDAALLRVRAADALLASGRRDEALAAARAAVADVDLPAVRWQAAQVLARAGERGEAAGLVDRAGQPLTFADLLFLHDLDVAEDPEAGVYGARPVGPTLARRPRVAAGDADVLAARFVDGLAARVAGEDDAALAAFDEVVRAGEGLPWAQLERAALRLRRGEAAAALADLDDLVDTVDAAEVRWLALVLRARAHLARGALELAEADCDRALAVAPGRRSARLVRAEARLGLSRAAEAREDLAAAEAVPRWAARARVARARSLLLLEVDRGAAAAEARRALQADPDLAAAHAALAEVLLSRDPGELRPADLDAAQAAAERALALDPGVGAFHALRLKVVTFRGDLAGARAGCDEALARLPRSAALLYLRGQVRFVSRDLPGALADTAAALEVAPEDAVYRVVHAQLLAASGDLRRARAELDAVVARRPGFPEARVRRVEHIVTREVPALDPQDPVARARALRVAIGDLDALAAVRPDDPQVLIERARRRVEVLDVGGAVTDAAAVLRLGAPPALQVEARRIIVRHGWLAAPGRVAEEAAALARAGLAGPDEHLAVWRAALEARDLSAAAAAASEALALDPGAGEARFARAVARGAAGDLRGALADWDALAGLASGRVTALLGRSGVRLGLGDPPGALADAEAAVAALPAEPSARLARARAREAAGDRAGAAADLEEALRRLEAPDPRIAEARAALGRLR